MITDDISFHYRRAIENVRKIAVKTPLQFNQRLSKKYNANIYLKREDMQLTRSYKIRGAYNMLSSLGKKNMQKGVVCASAGNHAQGFALCCERMVMDGIAFMPLSTPKQKIKQTANFGKDAVSIRLHGETFDECEQAARHFAEDTGRTFIPAFDHPRIIEGQSTVAAEILEDLPHFDYLILPVGGGGLAAGMGSYVRSHTSDVKIFGVEPAGAASMTAALSNRGPVSLHQIDTFVDGAAVKKVGELTYEICSKVLDDISTIDEGKICSTLLELYNEDAIIAEPAGSLSVAGLDNYADQLQDKTVVCIISGGNNDVYRIPEIISRSLQYGRLKS